LNSILFIS